MKIRVRKFVKKHLPETVEVKGHILTQAKQVPPNWNGQLELNEMVDLYKSQGNVVAVVKVLTKSKSFIYTNQ